MLNVSIKWVVGTFKIDVLYALNFLLSIDKKRKIYFSKFDFLKSIITCHTLKRDKF